MKKPEIKIAGYVRFAKGDTALRVFGDSKRGFFIAGYEGDTIINTEESGPKFKTFGKAVTYAMAHFKTKPE